MRWFVRRWRRLYQPRDRTTASSLDARAQVRQARSLVDRIDVLRGKRAEAEVALGSAGKVTDERPGLPATSVQAISTAVEDIARSLALPA